MRRLHPEAQVPSYQQPGDAGADLYSLVDATVVPGVVALLPTGIALELPEGYEGQIRSRSGLAFQGISVANSPGTIDSGFRGEVKVLLQNVGKLPYGVRRGDRIAQLVVSPVEQARFEEVAELGASARGTAGFGSSGR